MPITAYSLNAEREVDLEQWLILNQYSIKDDPLLERIPDALREKATRDIECSGCQTRGAMLVGVGRQHGVGNSVSQGHFRFATSSGTTPHNPLCDFYFDEKTPRDTEYLVNFANDRAKLTRVVRDLVCRGIRARRFGQADIRGMRLWFLEQKAAHAMPVDVVPELLQWCIEMDVMRWEGKLPFQPEHVQLPGFDWIGSAKSEWCRRNVALFEGRPKGVWFRSDETNLRARRLVELGNRGTVLDPTALRKKYQAVTQLADFAALYVHRLAGARPPAHAQFQSLKSAGRALLALCALLLFVNDWELGPASAVFADLTALPSAADGVEGNVMGLNPFHDYEAWQILQEAGRVASLRTDVRPISMQVETIRAELKAIHMGWLGRSTNAEGTP